MNPLFLELYARSADRKPIDWAAVNTRYLLDQGVDVRRNPGVCHGLTGSAASLYAMYALTGEPGRYSPESAVSCGAMVSQSCSIHSTRARRRAASRRS